MDFWAHWFDVTHGVFSYANAGLIRYREAPRREICRLIRAFQRSREMRVSPVEAFQLYTLARDCSKVPGAFAEVGVYKGGTARILCHARAESKPVHLFDTFEGLPPPVPGDRGCFVEGKFSCGVESVQKYLAAYPDVYFHQGLFPATAEAIAGVTFALVHLDVDLYQSTKDGLEFFWPRMSPGGAIVSHDYIYADGPTRAFREFFAGRPEPVLELSGNQCLVVKST